MDATSVIPSFLPESHRRALEWFCAHAGQIVHWPQPLDDGTLLAGKAKAIYKPAGQDYVFSIRENINSPYPDMPPVRRPDGTWLYSYFQEDLDPESRDSAYTNRGLINCMNDSVPVGVFRQVKLKPNSQYLVEGIAFVASWADGFFTFEGVSPSGVKYLGAVMEGADNYVTQDVIDDFILENEAGVILDARRKVSRLIHQRQGQTKFRAEVLDAYDLSCAVTSYDAAPALEAAHILPYRGKYTNHVQNGILMRADIHNLFDQGLIAISPDDDLRILVSPKLSGTRYEELAGRELTRPKDVAFMPSLSALRHHAGWSGLI